MAIRTVWMWIILAFQISSVHGSDIYQAIDSGHVELVSDIIEQNPDLINLPNSDNLTPLNLAAYRGQAEIVKILLNAGADVTIGDNENSQPIHNAAVGGHLEVVDILINHGVDINCQDDNGATALSFAVSYGRSEMVKYLLSMGVDPTIKNTYGRPPLHLAIMNRQFEIAELLVQSGVSVDSISSKPFAPITWAIRNGDLAMIEMFVGNGAKIQQTTPLGESYLHFAVFFNKPELVEYFVESEIDVNVVKRGNLTPLHIAAVLGHTDIATFLIDYGAELNIPSADGGTPLHFARTARNEAMVELLLVRGAEDSPRDFPEYRGEYLGAKKPGDDPEPFAPELFQDIYRPHGPPTFSPDGREIYWEAMFMMGVNNASRVWFMKEENGLWQAPRVAIFADYPSGGPTFCQNGQKLIYHSLRPRSDTSDMAQDLDLWMVERTGEDWGDPIHLDSPLNADGSHEVCMHMTDDCTIYIQKRARGFVQYGLVDGKYEEVGIIGDFFDTDYVDTCRSMKQIILMSDRQKERFHFQLFAGFHRPDGRWTEPVYLGDRLHQGKRADSGRISPDGNYLFFSRNFGFYWIDAEIIEDLRP
ncbi:MAG: ankyrin repeat domain-containing protein [Planctomycetota bacterium]